MKPEIAFRSMPLAAVYPGQTAITIARVPHPCGGVDDDGQHVRCPRPIHQGELYVEWKGNATKFHGSRRYHVACAYTQGLLTTNEPLYAQSLRIAAMAGVE